jgi:1-acyl-sn-glycerol-3-phosphate acyltransferase
MQTWFFHPGSILTSWLLWLVGPGRVEGLEHAPRSGPYILVSNHCSNLDPLFAGWAVGHQTGRVIHFMAKAELRRWPLIGWLAKEAGVFFVRRGEADRAAQRMANDLLAQGRPLGLFPEGTRSRDGQLRHGRAGAALLAMRAGVPLLPVGIAGTHRIFAGGRRIPRRSSITIRIGQTFSLPAPNVEGLDREVLHEATARIMSEIAALLPANQGGRLPPEVRARR